LFIVVDRGQILAPGACAENLW